METRFCFCCSCNSKLFASKWKYHKKLVQVLVQERNSEVPVFCQEWPTSNFSRGATRIVKIELMVLHLVAEIINLPIFP